MFRLFSHKLTAASNYFIDWSRIGELIGSGKHHYSPEELAVRGVIVLTTATSAFLGYHLNNEEATYSSNTTIAIAAALTSFTVSHLIAISPLIYKRYKMSQACDKLVTEIRMKTSELPDISHISLHKTIKHILNLSLTNEKHANASLTWGKRKHLLHQLNAKLENKDEVFLFLLEMGNVDIIVANLVGDTTVISRLRR